MSEFPAPVVVGYSYALTTIPLNSVKGVYAFTGRKGERRGIVGNVTLNIVNGTLSSVTVRRSNGRKAVNVKAHRLSGTFLGNAQDTLTFAAFTR